jgi:hypothetical protein
MNFFTILTKHLRPLHMLSLLVIVGCAPLLTPTPTTVGPQCNIVWDKTPDPKVTWYQVTVTDESTQAKKIVQFIPSKNTAVSCKDAGADHEGTWNVSVRSCYDKSTCGPPTEVTRIHITAQ